MTTRVWLVMLRVCRAWGKKDVDFHKGWNSCLCGSGGGGSGVDGSGGVGGVVGSGESSGVGDSGESVERIVYSSGGGGRSIVYRSGEGGLYRSG